MHHSLCLYCALCPGYELSLRQYCGQLCDWGSGYGTLQCKWVDSCPGTAPGTVSTGHCYPYGLWSGTEPEAAYYFSHRLYSNLLSGTECYTGTTGKCSHTFAFSVRCVSWIYFVTFQRTLTKSLYQLVLVIVLSYNDKFCKHSVLEHKPLLQRRLCEQTAGTLRWRQGISR